MSIDPASDFADLDLLRQGDDAALDRIVARWQKPLVGFAFRYLQNAADARDLTADTFVRLYQHRLRLKPDTRLKAWLFTTLANLCHNLNRWKRRHPQASWEPAAIASSEAAPNLALEQGERVAALQRAIAELAHDARVTLLLYHYDQLSYREIAAILNCSEKGVETRLSRARFQLRARLKLA